MEIQIHNKSIFNFLNTATESNIPHTTNEKFNWKGTAFELVPIGHKFSNITFQLMPDRYRPQFLKVNGLELSLSRPSFEEVFTIKGEEHNLVVKLHKIADFLRVKLESEKKRSNNIRYHHRRIVSEAPLPVMKSSHRTWIILPIIHPNLSEEILKRTLRKHRFWERDIRHIIEDFHHLRNQNRCGRFIEIEVDIKRKVVANMTPTC